MTPHRKVAVVGQVPRRRSGRQSFRSSRRRSRCRHLWMGQKWGSLFGDPSCQLSVGGKAVDLATIRESNEL